MTESKIKQKLKSKKRGGASMFVVLFTIIILSVIVLSFTRLIISEATKTTNTDLSQSAYDSALAGVEDAKVALLKYHACLDDGYIAQNGGNTCQQMIYDMQKGMQDNDCSTVQKALKRESGESTENAVVVQETQTSNQEGNNANMLQAYTCVTIKEDLEDYRTTLDSSSRLRIVPIRTDTDTVGSLDYIELRWFSSTNAAKLTNRPYCSGNFFPASLCKDGSVTDIQAPPVLMARLIQTDRDFNLSELSASSSAGATDTSTMMLVPTRNGGTNTINKTDWGEEANKGENNPTNINCTPSASSQWYCYVKAYIPNTFNDSTDRNAANTYLLVSLPYGVPETDVSIMAYGTGGASSKYEFRGVQARVDSTGRANDLYRRVETRVELVDTYFAYPEFEITMTGGSGSVLDKTFWVTLNCWGANNGADFGCYDSYDVGSSSSY